MTKIECEKCHQVGSLQVLGNYCRVRHQVIDSETKTTKFLWHQNTKPYVDQRLRELAIVQPNIVQTDQKLNDLTSDQGASSSVRIEHQPPKLGVVGSNPTPPAYNKPQTQTDFL